MNIVNIVDSVLKLASTDSSFRKRLLKSSESAKEALLEQGIQTPEKLKLVFHEQYTQGEMHFVLPQAELNEEQLEQIAGGKTEEAPVDIFTGEVRYNSLSEREIRVLHPDNTYEWVRSSYNGW